jgi:hypothetical protein
MKRKLLTSIFIITTLAIFNLYGEDTISHKQGISIGFDLYGPVNKIFQPSMTSYEASLNAGSFYRFFPVIEGGYLKIADKTNTFNYNSNGNFISFGFDYNFYKKNLPWENNILFVGLRYGFSSLTHKADNIVVIDSLWGNFHSSLNETKVKAQWVEAVGGIRVEVLKNFSIGWSVSFNMLTVTSGMNQIKPFVIPGFGSGAGTTAFGFNYSLYYTFPLKKEKSYFPK